MSCRSVVFLGLLVANDRETAKTDDPIEMSLVRLWAQGTIPYVDRARVPHIKDHRHVPDTGKSQRAGYFYRCSVVSLQCRLAGVAFYSASEKIRPCDAACSQITMSILLWNVTYNIGCLPVTTRTKTCADALWILPFCFVFFQRNQTAKNPDGLAETWASVIWF